MVSSTPRPHFIPGKDMVPILQEAGWVPGRVSTGGKSRPHRNSIPDRPARSHSLYRLSYPAHKTPATSPRKIATLTLQSHSSRDSSEDSGRTVVRLHNELPESDGFISDNGRNNFSCTVDTKVLRPLKSSVQ